LHSNVVESRALAVIRNGKEEKKWEDKKRQMKTPLTQTTKRIRTQQNKYQRKKNQDNSTDIMDLKQNTHRNTAQGPLSQVDN
jgi:hypothetical protein